MKKLRVKLIKSPIDRMQRHKRTLRALGLRRVGQEAILADNPQVRGMVRQVSYMVEVKTLGKGDK